MERLAAEFPARGIEPMEVTRDELIRELRELIAALDRRGARVERAGEAAIARDAAALREKAVKRLAELEPGEVPARLDTSNRVT